MERPLVTFAVFAYNQEKYIRETVAAALAQAYDRLEIILSDDCSTDGTFAIMQQIVAGYSGPHDVRAICQEQNLGTVNHMITVARLARGGLFIGNAGDDISHPHRTEELVKCWQTTGATALSSFHDEISEDGTTLKKNCSFPVSKATQIIFAKSKVAQRVDGYVQSVPGFAAAYQREFWAQLPLSESKLLIEDGIAGAILNIRGERIERVRKSLISYRILQTSLSLRQAGNSRDEILARERKMNVTAGNIVSMTDYILQNACLPGRAIEAPVYRGLMKGKHYGLIVHGFWDEGPSKRLGKMLRVRTGEEFLYVLPRIFGSEPFVLLKLFSLWIKKKLQLRQVL